MGCNCPSVFVVIFSIKIAVISIVVYFTIPSIPDIPIVSKDNWFGKGERQAEDTSIKPFEVSVSQQTLDDLNHRLQNTRLFDGIEQAQWEYGTNMEYLKELIDYWRTKYDWKAQQKLLNSYPNFQTNIDGLKIHYWHVKPQVKPGQTVVPIMFIHGWPGSFFEFYKVIQLLAEHSKKGKFSFEIICPSIPGYGFSEAPHKPGLDTVMTGVIFGKLMTRLGHESYYVQGGDWGSSVARTMALLNKRNVKGIHLNMFPVSAPYGPWSYLIGYFTLPVQEHNKVFPLKDLFFKLLLESGYFHIQATRPDSVGVGLNSSPAGLAAYIVEKFFVWSGCSCNASSACLDSLFTKDELLTNLMIYWVTNTITPSMRYYKENILSNVSLDIGRIPIDVPSGIAEFPNELVLTPKPWVLASFPNNIQFSVMEKGGHFPAFEQPEMFVNDVVKFVEKVEVMSGTKV